MHTGRAESTLPVSLKRMAFIFLSRAFGHIPARPPSSVPPTIMERSKRKHTDEGLDMWIPDDDEGLDVWNLVPVPPPPGLQPLPPPGQPLPPQPKLRIVGEEQDACYLITSRLQEAWGEANRRWAPITASGLAVLLVVNSSSCTPDLRLKISKVKAACKSVYCDDPTDSTALTDEQLVSMLELASHEAGKKLVAELLEHMPHPRTNQEPLSSLQVLQLCSALGMDQVLLPHIRAALRRALTVYTSKIRRRAPGEPCRTAKAARVATVAKRVHGVKAQHEIVVRRIVPDAFHVHKRSNQEVTVVGSSYLGERHSAVVRVILLCKYLADDPKATGVAHGQHYDQVRQPILKLLRRGCKKTWGAKGAIIHVPIPDSLHKFLRPQSTPSVKKWRAVLKGVVTGTFMRPDQVNLELMLATLRAAPVIMMDDSGYDMLNTLISAASQRCWEHAMDSPPKVVMDWRLWRLLEFAWCMATDYIVEPYHYDTACKTLRTLDADYKEQDDLSKQERQQRRLRLLLPTVMVDQVFTFSPSRGTEAERRLVMQCCYGTTVPSLALLRQSPRAKKPRLG